KLDQRSPDTQAIRSAIRIPRRAIISFCWSWATTSIERADVAYETKTGRGETTVAATQAALECSCRRSQAFGFSGTLAFHRLAHAQEQTQCELSTSKRI